MANTDWDGTTLGGSLREVHLAERDRLASAARDGEWATVLGMIERSPSLVNAWRPGGNSWFTPVHQAAWLGASPEVVRRMVARGPWLTLRTAAGDRALDIALRRGNAHLAGLLTPVIRHPLRTGVLGGHLHDLIRERADHLVREHRLRLPELEVLTELEKPDMFFPVPGMYGGFGYRLEGEGLVVRSFCRVVGGSGQTHRITTAGCVLVEDGWG
ncbi:ankyrin repeat domain-containing protein [Actinokineospora auranticolor]|uniref:Ankyrin repeat protein n=1 Tax=Actinokineospora auranticolor TaxID=155976 RepID=A0A2S6GJB4_9PSEU|nr:ankyrin repeat domain-containing protein [Actinokineospora auranticolor]PPK65309.1 ankyrin repeat protein [Actinokineospora auranticolor]